ncbi:MAG: TIGR03790 family protein [Thiotrichales bacterium]|nr:MAG: TIGR03790 family protein [Thiotrichales bacterium]
MSFPGLFIFVLTVTWVSSPAAAISVAQQLAIVVNKDDPQSRRIADYYQVMRGIPDENVIEVNMPVGKNRIGAEKFKKIYQQVRNSTPAYVQFYALAWSRPFRAGCMSITSAFAFGFDEAYCAKGCNSTRQSAYFNSATRTPWRDYGMRPSMMLAGSSLEQIQDMIDRGVKADASYPKGTAYLVSTSDKARNVRSHFFPSAAEQLGKRIDIKIESTDALTGRDDVLFYITGKVRVDKIETNRFVGGAIADHLTSAGGVLFGGRQMSILRWLDAGATASYGTVVEPCAFPQKFPHPGVVIDRYTRGETLIEAYWKSVAWPGQGVFVGEPLASPYAGII